MLFPSLSFSLDRFYSRLCTADDMSGDARRRLITYYPVEESVTFKMACSQGALPVIRDMHYGLWSHPVNICIYVCLRVRVRVHASELKVSLDALIAIWLSDTDPRFPPPPTYSRPTLAVCI